jgi:hypothetical protein
MEGSGYGEEMKTFTELSETVIDENKIEATEMSPEMQKIYVNVTRIVRGAGIGIPDDIIASDAHKMIFVYSVKKAVTFSKFDLGTIMKTTGKRLVDITITGNGKMNIIVRGE